MPKLSNDNRLPHEVADKTYRAIGLFIYEFSQTEYTLRHFLGEKLELEEDYFSAVVESYNVALLCNVAKSVFKTALSQRRYERVEKFINQFYKLNEQRVRVAHGLWVPHFDGGRLHHVSSTTLKSRQYTEQAETLEKLASEVSDIRQDLFDAIISLESEVGIGD